MWLCIDSPTPFHHQQNISSLFPCLSVDSHSDSDKPGSLHLPSTYELAQEQNCTYRRRRMPAILPGGLHQPGHGSWVAPLTLTDPAHVRVYMGQQLPNPQPWGRCTHPQHSYLLPLCLFLGPHNVLNDFSNLHTLRFTLCAVKSYEFWQMQNIIHSQNLSSITHLYISHT